MAKADSVTKEAEASLEFFNRQVRAAVKAGLHQTMYKTEDEFLEWLFPLHRALVGRTAKCHVRGLLVFPHTALPGKSKVSLIEQLSTPARKIDFNADGDDYLEWFKDVRGIPKEPYLALDVIDGREYCGSLRFEKEFKDKAARALSGLKRKGLTLEEGLWLWKSFGEELGFDNARLLSTRYGKEGWADIRQKTTGGLEIDDYNVDGASYVWRFRVPSCGARIALSKVSGRT